AIGVIFVEPEPGAAGEHGPDFTAAVIEDVAAPVRVIALPRIGVLVEMRPVEICEPVLVPGEMRRDPVENDADAVAVQLIDEKHEVLRRAVTRRRREVACRLIAPGTVKRMLCRRQEFDMRESHIDDITGKLLRKLAIGQKYAPV